MMEILIGAIAMLTAAGIGIFIGLIVIDIALFLKLRSMFDRGMPFAGY